MGLGVQTFPRGVFISQHKQPDKEGTERRQIKAANVPDILVIPVEQPIGVAAQPVVKKGDRVLMGQMIAEAQGDRGTPVHSSVSGTVTAVEPRMHASGTRVMSIIIQNDHLDEAEMMPQLQWQSSGASVLLQRVKDAGIVGMGGAGYPTYLKLTPHADQKIDTVILNGSECEPYLSGDCCIMAEHAVEIAVGLQILMKVLGTNKALIGIEDNKPQAINALKDAVRGIAGVEVRALKSKYPQGAEKQIIQTLTGKQVPRNGLPYQIGVAVFNVSTAFAVSQAVQQGKPLMERVVTVAVPELDKSVNLTVRIGTSVEFLLQQLTDDLSFVRKVCLGGPMMGVTLSDLQVPVIKTSGGIVAFGQKQAVLPSPTPCIRCGLCAASCPLNLQPLLIERSVQQGNYEDAKRMHAQACCECGTCSYVCPANRPLVHAIRTAKYELHKTTV